MQLSKARYDDKFSKFILIKFSFSEKINKSLQPWNNSLFLFLKIIKSWKVYNERLLITFNLYITKWYICVYKNILKILHFDEFSVVCTRILNLEWRSEIFRIKNTLQIKLQSNFVYPDTFRTKKSDVISGMLQ